MAHQIFDTILRINVTEQYIFFLHRPFSLQVSQVVLRLLLLLYCIENRIIIGHGELMHKQTLTDTLIHAIHLFGQLCHFSIYAIVSDRRRGKVNDVAVRKNASKRTWLLKMYVNAPTVICIMAQRIIFGFNHHQCLSIVFYWWTI